MKKTTTANFNKIALELTSKSIKPVYTGKIKLSSVVANVVKLTLFLFSLQQFVLVHTKLLYLCGFFGL